MRIRTFCLLLVLAPMLVHGAPTNSAQPDPAYIKVTNERAERIVATLGVTDQGKAGRVRDLIANFYRDLNALQTARDARIAAAKTGAAKDARDAEIKVARDETDAQRTRLHDAFLARLAVELTPAQIEEVKDGLTYGVLPLTFRVYQQMLPNLTAEQTAQIHAWLVEAREHAMSGFSSEEKHGWFGKYKGRINNYLAKAGYNMKQAEKDMMARQKQTAQ